jgi:ssDNA-binding Zn-finger/Zn-ribbon topoisomerase 1
MCKEERAMNICEKCGKAFDYYESFYTDICDSCTEIVEGKTIEELEKEDSKYDDYVLTQKVTE